MYFFSITKLNNHIKTIIIKFNHFNYFFHTTFTNISWGDMPLIKITDNIHILAIIGFPDIHQSYIHFFLKVFFENLLS